MIPVAVVQVSTLGIKHVFFGGDDNSTRRTIALLCKTAEGEAFKIACLAEL